MEGDLRIVGTSLDADLAARDVRVDRLGRQRRHLPQLGRALRPQAEPVDAVALEQPRPEAERDREPARQVAEGLTRVVGRQQRLVVARPDRFAGGEGGRGERPVAQQRLELGTVLGGDVEGREEQTVLLGGDDPGLALAPVRDRARALGVIVRGPLLPEGIAGGAAEPKRGTGGPCRRQDAPPRQSAAGPGGVESLLVGQPTSAGTCESGSPSVSICCASSCVCSSLSVS